MIAAPELSRSQHGSRRYSANLFVSLEPGDTVEGVNAWSAEEVLFWVWKVSTFPCLDETCVFACLKLRVREHGLGKGRYRRGKVVSDLNNNSEFDAN